MRSVCSFRTIRVRHFSGSPLICNTAEGADAQTNNTRPAAEGLSRNATQHSHRKAFIQWATTRGEQYKLFDPQKPRNYLDGKSHPFPLNPQFQPQLPVSTTTRDAIYSDWRAGAGLRQISQGYGIALDRVEAILKLQEVSKRWQEEVSISKSRSQVRDNDAIFD